MHFPHYLYRERKSNYFIRPFSGAYKFVAFSKLKVKQTRTHTSIFQLNTLFRHIFFSCTYSFKLLNVVLCYYVYKFALRTIL